MLNPEFQELKRLWSIAPEPTRMREYLVQKMRENLKKRNGNNSDYFKAYTSKGDYFNIDECEYEELSEIDGDMAPRGM